MADESSFSLQPGTVIQGRYEVVKCLGAGSMGMVYACRHRELTGHMVAVKVLFPEVAQDKVAAARFRNEIFASYGVSHPNVVRAYEYIRDGDIVAYTMEYVGGGDLARRLSRSQDRIPIPDVISILSQMCSGVQAIHDAGIVHRDLKPENIMLTEDGTVKIADFGIARTGHGSKLTEHGGVVGTIDYVSPEYILESKVDWRSDIYAMGILAYEMVTGESPFRGDSVYATMTKRLKTDPRPPTDLRPDCPAELSRIILKAMARDPLQRYQSAAEMFYDLQALGGAADPRNSSAYLRMSQRSSAAYVGPKYVAEQGTPAAAPPPTVPSSRQQSAPPPSSRVQRTVVVQDDPPAEATVQARVSSARQNYSTESITPRVLHGQHATVGFGNDYPATEGRMERLLSTGGQSIGRPRESGGSAAPISVSAGSINPERMKALAKAGDRFSRSAWIDRMMWLTAVLIGLMLGTAVVNILITMFKNDIVTRPASAPSVIEFQARDAEYQ